MSPEVQPERRRLSRGKRKYIRKSKRENRKVLGITQPSPDTVGFSAAVAFLRMKLPDYDENFAPHYPILEEFYEIREEIRLKGFQKELVREFQTKHDPELLRKLSRGFTLLTEWVGKRR